MTTAPPPPPALMRLFGSWLTTCQAEVRDHLAQNGDHATPAQIADTCPSLCGSVETAAWILENKQEPEEEPCTTHARTDL